jgi:tripartite-type tricarboxylate transporter receptor subunit TctC
MKLPHRRQFLHLAAGAAALPAASRVARAQTYPTRPLRIIVGFPPGGSFDLVARIVGQWLSERLGQPFVAENRPGAGGNLATDAVVRASPDGYTLLLFGVVNAVNASLMSNLTFDFVRDIQPIAGATRNPFVMLANPSFPARSIPELIAYAKANPGNVNFGTGGVGTGLHVSGEVFNMMAGIHMTHVPYRGEAPAVTDLLGGQIQLAFVNPPVAIEQIRSGKLRALAVTTTTRSDFFPDVPAISEFLPGYDASGWQGIGAPRNTPVDVVDKLNHEIQTGLADARIKSRLADFGSVPWLGKPPEIAKFIADETEKWAKVIRAANIKLE